MNSDLISRSELKKAMDKLFESGGYDSGLVMNIIDNAPTVTPDKIQAIMSDYLIYRCEPERPQGEWITKGYEPYGRCNICGEICEINNFCGYCGADMREGYDGQGSKNETNLFQ